MHFITWPALIVRCTVLRNYNDSDEDNDKHNYDEDDVIIMMRMISGNEARDESKNVGLLLLTLVEKPYMTKTENLREYINIMEFNQDKEES